MPSQARAAQMRRVAVINLKKEGGGARTAGGELQEAVQTQHKEIFAEIELCGMRGHELFQRLYHDMLLVRRKILA